MALADMMRPFARRGVVTAPIESGIGRATTLTGNRDMAEFKHGSMDVTEHEKTFEGFVKWSVRVAIFTIAILLFLAVFNS